jgi:hypothetical protein
MRRLEESGHDGEGSGTLYDGRDTYDFEAALASAKTAEPETGLTAEQRYWHLFLPEAPSELALQRHARRYGKECVSEIADAYGLTSAAAELAETSGKRRRRTSETMRAQVIALHERGVVPAAIADALNISDSRVRKLLAQAA